MAEKSKSKKSKTVTKKTPKNRAKRSEFSGQEVLFDDEQTAEDAVSNPTASLEAPVTKRVVIGKTDETSENRRHEPTNSDTPEGKSFLSSSRHSSPSHGGDNKASPERESLTVGLSRSLIRKLKEQALDEGISLEEFVTELLSESVVLRAWEIVERKSQMKGGNNHSNSMGNSRNNSSPSPSHNARGQRGNKGNSRGMNHLRYQAIMDDKASFLEYVRSQERGQR